MKGITAKQYDDFSKGINTFTRDTMLTEKESADGYNIWSVGKNSLAKRPGLVLAGEIAGVGAIDGMGTYYSGSTRELLIMAGGKLYKLNPITGSASQIGSTTWTSGLKTDFCQAGAKVFIANGTDVMREYDGSTIADTTNGIVCKYLIYYKNSLWGCGNATYPTRLYRSGIDTKIGDFTYNVTTNPLATSVYISKDDGQDLKGFYKYQDYLYAVKERSLFRISQGTDAYGIITTELVDASRGTDSHFSIDAVDNDTFMFNESGVYATGYEPNFQDQLRTNIISLRVDTKVKTIEKSKLDDVAGIYFDSHYYLSYASGGATANNTMLVYDRQRLGWWEWSIGARSFCEFKDTAGYSKLYLGSPTDGKVYFFDSSVKEDSGYTIVTSWKSPKYGFGNYAQEKFFLHCLLYVGKTQGEVTITIYIDGKTSKTKTVTIGSIGARGIGVGKIGTFKIGVEGGSITAGDNGGSDIIKIPINKMGRNIQIQVEDNTGNKTWELNSLEVAYKPLDSLYQPNTK